MDVIGVLFSLIPLVWLLIIAKHVYSMILENKMPVAQRIDLEDCEGCEIRGLAEECR